jgi:hypothetical protein
MSNTQKKKQKKKPMDQFQLLDLQYLPAPLKLMRQKSAKDWVSGETYTRNTIHVRPLVWREIGQVGSSGKKMFSAVYLLVSWEK